MSVRNKAGVWVIPKKEAEELMYGKIDFNQLVKDCLGYTPCKPKWCAPTDSLKEVKLKIEEKRLKDEMEKGLLHRDLNTLFK